MPLPDWLKARDEIEEPQPRAAKRQPDPEPEDEAPDEQVVDDDLLEDEAPEDEAPEDEAEPEEEPDEEPEAPQDKPLQPPPKKATAPKPKAKKAKAPEPQAKKPRDLMAVALDPPETPEAPAAKDVPSTAGDQVLSMLSSIEKQLTRLGDVQREHEDQLSDLVDRSSSGPLAGGAGDEPPAQKQPSFVVEMDDDEPAPPDGEQPEGLAMLASGLQSSRKQAGKMQQQLQEAQARIKGQADQPDDSAELQEKTEQLDAANQKIDDLKARLIELEAIASVTDDDVDDTDAAEKDTQIAALNSEVRQLQAELRSRKEAAAEAAAKPAPEPDSPGAEMIERQRKQIERLTEQLDAANAGVEPKEIVARDARIAKLEEELEEAQSQGGGKQAMSKLVAGVGGALRQVRGKKDDEEDYEGVSELEERVAELEIERKHARDDAEQAKREAEHLRQTLQEAADGDGGSDALEVAALRARVAELESAPNAGHAELRSKIESELRQKWNEVKQRQDALKVTEAKMRRKWARPRAVVVFAHLAGVAVVVGIVSWLLAGGLFPATIAASLNIEAKSKSGAPVSDDNKAQWQHVHTAMLENESFLERVSERLTEQRFDSYEDPEVLAECLKDDLTVDSAKAGSITLTLVGKDRSDTTFVLDTLASTLAMQSAQQAGKRSDDAVAIVRGERREGGQVRYASIRDRPISDRRPIWAVVLFVLGFVATVFSIQRLQQTLIKTKSAMADDDPTAGADLF